MLLARRRSVERLACSLRVDLDEAVNSAACRALAALAAYRPEKGTLTAWLNAILRNAIYQLGRDARRDRLGRRAWNGDAPDPRQREGLDLLAAQEKAERAEALLRSAGPFIRRVARLRQRGLTFRRIARRLGVPMSLVTGRWFAWRRSALRRLED
jgi:RNA polymerase sigma factor (sigma-70 family)